MTLTADHDLSTTAPTAADNARRIEELGRIIMAYSDVTERLQASHDQLLQTVGLLQQELSEKNRLLERKQRLAALGEMAAGLAHEIRNPLGGIQLYASLLARDVEDRPASLTTVQKISKGVKHLESLVGQVLHFTREMNASPAAMDLADVLRNTVDLASPSAEAKSAQVTLIGPDALPVIADATLIGQAVLNLVLNAVDAIADGGRVTIEYFAPPAGSTAQQFHLIVTDDGPGIPSGAIDSIFNPFFTTKDTGTGLGLSIVHRVVEAHDGTIVVTNLDSVGARFEIRI
ncbi:MAG TPA: ATP-binding protein [Tepidisphaeraceae bacterium]|jgi:signal transduction histidine kinase|nr:ATP-binding protein [Tepidisphaeraceae bacterium]